MSTTPPDELIALMPYAAALGITLQRSDPDEVQGSLEWAQARCTIGGLLHGGVLMSLADTVGAVCAFLNLPDGATTATVESKTNFFRAAREGTVRATSRPLHVGRSFVTVQTDLVNEQGLRLGQTTQTQAVLQQRT
jgi:1,4-dihydroxy-2-naphthoyl-CoA hydrolase